MTASPRARIALRVVALGYLAALLVMPVGLIVYVTFEDGLEPAIDAITRPEGQHAFWLTIVCVGIAVPLNTVFGVVCAIVLVRHRFRGKGILNTLIDLPFAISPVVVGLSLLLVYGINGWAGPDAGRGRDPGDLLHARHDPGHDLRLAAVRGARDHAGAPGDRHRAGAGRQHARRVGLADVLARHAAGHPLGRGLRRDPVHGARSRRVRGGERGVGPHLRRDRDASALRREAVPELRHRRRVRRRDRAGRYWR